MRTLHYIVAPFLFVGLLCGAPAPTIAEARKFLADADKKVATLFGVVKEKNMYGKKVMGIARTTFLISPDGKIAHTFENVKPEGHAEEVLAHIKASAKA